jgi:polyphosphate kinase 2 (PPK2 family)
MTTNHKKIIADNIKNKIKYLKVESLKYGGEATSFGGAMYKSHHASRVRDYLTEDEIKDKLTTLLTEINDLEKMLSNLKQN